MIKVQLLGTRNKTDLAIFLANAVVGQGKRALIVDCTKEQLYKYGFGHTDSDSEIFEIQGVDVLTAAVTSWDDVVKATRKENSDVTNYEIVIVDFDHLAPLQGDWADFNRTIYTGDNDRFAINRDVELLHSFMDMVGEDLPIQHVHFESAYHVPAGYLELLMNNRLEFKDIYYEIEYDERLESIRQSMQHNRIIPQTKISKEYRVMISEIVASLYGVTTNEVSEGVEKPSIFSRIFSKPVKAEK
ncbi:hypothetical protein [Solibacillus sp. NPDC093137]|uniref:hypothetical protein n=1 Tax=Solibacillus sp. NPDC093137 TaxID=3390678 RepID=UPI003D035B44